MDEPASALDPIATAKIEDLVADLRGELTIVIVTHNMQQAARVSQRTGFFYMGRLVEVGETSQIFTRPKAARDRGLHHRPIRLSYQETSRMRPLSSSALAAPLVLALTLAACTRTEPQATTAPDGGVGTAADKATISVKGSDTMVILGQRWAEAYMKDSPGITIQVTGGGSGTGIAALINGTTDICEASRPMKDAEKADVQSKRGAPAIETKVALDALAVYVNDKSPLQEISDPRPAQDLRGRDEELEGRGRARPRHRPVRPREQLRDVRLLQGARAREQGLRRVRADARGHLRRRQRRQGRRRSASATAASRTSRASAPSR